MEISPRNYILINIATQFSLENTAEKVGIIFPDLKLKLTDKYNEIPAFESDMGEFRYTLFGYPDEESNLLDQPTDRYQLKIYPLGMTIDELDDVSSKIAPEIQNRLGIRCWI